jgi:hypothetical protein
MQTSVLGMRMWLEQQSNHQIQQQQRACMRSQLNKHHSSRKCMQIVSTSGRYVTAFVSLGQGDIVPPEVQAGGNDELDIE